MIIKPARNAGIFLAVIAVAAIVLTYTLVGTVDLVFRDGGREVYRIEDASAFADLTVPEGENWSFVYETDSGDKEFSDSIEFRFEIAKTVLMRFVGLNWEENENVIIMYKK